jgi:hypothetical protein
MHHVRERTGEEESEQAGCARHRAMPAPETEDAEKEERRNDGEEFADLEGDKTRNQDSRGDGSHGREQRISQGD